MRIEDKDPDRHNAIEYPMEVGAPKFAPVPIKEEKDKAINIARAHANQEYDRIMEQAAVLMRQAKAFGKYRLVQNSPQEWSCGIPLGWSFCQAVRKLGDSTWEIIEEEAQ
jgi:hypothetical protein